MRFTSVLFLSLLFLVVAQGCKTREIAPIVVAETPKISQVDSVYSAMKNAEFRFHTLVAKFSGEYTIDGSKQNFSGQMRIVNDSLIWCSITVMNIEVARIMVCHDSVKLLNKLNRQYYQTTFQYVNNLLNTDIDFEMLQALILGNDIPYYEIDKFQLNSKSDEYELQTIGRKKLKKYVKSDDDLSKVLIQKMAVNKTNFRIIKQDLKQLRNPNKKVEALYSSFVDYQGMFPTKMEFKFIGVKEININLEFLKIEKDIPIELPFKIPSSYTIKYF